MPTKSTSYAKKKHAIRKLLLSIEYTEKNNNTFELVGRRVIHGCSLDDKGARFYVINVKENVKTYTRYGKWDVLEISDNFIHNTLRFQ